VGVTRNPALGRYVDELANSYDKTVLFRSFIRVPLNGDTNNQYCYYLVKPSRVKPFISLVVCLNTSWVLVAVKDHNRLSKPFVSFILASWLMHSGRCLFSTYYEIVNRSSNLFRWGVAYVTHYPSIAFVTEQRIHCPCSIIFPPRLPVSWCLHAYFN
jgi:hypothetical protein